MSWILDEGRKVWKCSKYSDLNYAEINNLAEYGQPFSPYGNENFLHDYVPDFAKVIVEMPHQAVMNSGYGANIKATHFDVVNRFLNFYEKLPVGLYDFPQLIALGFAVDGDRWINTNLYGWGRYGVAAGSIVAGDAAYVHGSVSLALMPRTLFMVATGFRRVDAELGAGNDNWDFESSTIYGGLNATVAALLGPDHYNLTAPIQINFTGPGRTEIIIKNLF